MLIAELLSLQNSTSTLSTPKYFCPLYLGHVPHHVLTSVFACLGEGYIIVNVLEVRVWQNILPEDGTGRFLNVEKGPVQVDLWYSINLQCLTNQVPFRH